VISTKVTYLYHVKYDVSTLRHLRFLLGQRKLWGVPFQATYLVGDTLKKLRLDRGLTQADVADRAGLARTTVNRIERDAIAVGPKRLAALAVALDVSVLELAPAAAPDEPGLSLLSRLEALEDQAEKDRLSRERGTRAVLRRLADLEEALELQAHKSSPRSTGKGGG
jgi:transcriptional regulator with XRE-family HTH domain